jgi:cobalt-precorrin 5A hydrolase
VKAAMLAAGVGCRAHCDVEDVARAVMAALESGGRDLAEVHAIYAPDFKRDERCLSLIAEQLRKPILFFPLAELEKHSPGALTFSERVMLRYGVPSIAETAALAGAHALSLGAAIVRLVGPREVRGGATCALAGPESRRD